MFCMCCGQGLPDNAKFCMKCGTPAGEVSPIGSTTNNSDNRAFVPAMCPNCNAHMDVDPLYKIARCKSCGTECLVQDAIKALPVNGSIKVEGDVQVGNATINVGGNNVDGLLKRIEILLEDGDFLTAKDKCDAVLDIDPTNGLVYLFLLMTALGCKKREDIANQNRALECEEYYYKLLRFGNDFLKEEIESYKRVLDARIDERQKNPHRGDEIYFGTKDGLPLGWVVMGANADKHWINLICSEGICEMPFDDDPDRYSTSWENSSLRKWLNNDFYNNYFTPEEQARIVPVRIETPNVGNHSDITEDKISLPGFNYNIKDITNPRFFTSNKKYWWLQFFDGRAKKALCDNLYSKNDNWVDVRTSRIVRPFMRIRLMD